MNQDHHQQEGFEPGKDLRMENEIMKLKMLAESGADFAGIEDLPPEVEHVFLQHIQSFEEAWRNAREITVYDLIGRPDYKKEDELDDRDIDRELRDLLSLLASHHIVFRGLEAQEPRTVYRLITEELFRLETKDVQLPGMTTHFSYHERENEGEESY